MIDALGEAFAAGRYFDIFVDYAKGGEDDILCRITAYNRGPEPAAAAHPAADLVSQHLVVGLAMPSVPCSRPPEVAVVRSRHRHLGERWWYLDIEPHVPALLFTENETNFERLFGVPNAGPFVKDAFHEAIVGGRAENVNPGRRGLEGGGPLSRDDRGGRARVRCERGSRMTTSTDPFGDFDSIVERRMAEADEFYRAIQPAGLDDDQRHDSAPGVCRPALVQAVLSLQRRALARWRPGRTAAAGASGRHGRNAGWQHVYNLDVLSVPDKWEYPWFAAWDTRVSLHRAGPARPGVGQAAGGAPAARVVHAPQRPAPGL